MLWHIDINNRPIGNIVFNDAIDNGFIISGQQDQLIEAIENLTLIPLGAPSITITVKSTDESGASDEGSFIVNIINSDFSPASNQPSKNDIH